MLDEYPEDKLRAGRKKYICLMREFDVVDEIPASSVTDEELRGALDTTWVIMWKGLDVMGRPFRGCFHSVKGLDISSPRRQSYPI